MSINLKLRLFKGKTHADGTHPIQLQFYLNGKEKRKGIYFCHAKDWDEKTSRVKSKVTNSAYINNLLSEKYAEYERELLKVLNGENQSTAFFEIKKELTLDDVMKLELDRFVNENKPMTHARINSYTNELRLYFNSANTYIKDIDLRWFEKYAAMLSNDLYSGTELIRKGNIGSTAQKN
ncbi:Arm DNA-binding domain-containing protein [Mucilaginibacter sp. SP1R1]|uniref:Arm DNA-binding domain-containing protein n=1 Tax=Mucilaginibacter sp. SP1R1 TaxID=2723091 RepID=UPI003B00C8BC